MKKQGSILIEAIASIMILMLTTTFVVNSSIQASNKLKERILQEEVSRTVCNLINEFKFNVSKKEIDVMLMEGNNKRGFKYSKDLSKQLINTDVRELKHGNDIEIRKIEDSDIGLKLKITAKIHENDNEVTVEKEFIKSWWMDEI